MKPIALVMLASCEAPTDLAELYVDGPDPIADSRCRAVADWIDRHRRSDLVAEWGEGAATAGLGSCGNARTSASEGTVDAVATFRTEADGEPVWWHVVMHCHLERFDELWAASSCRLEAPVPAAGSDTAGAGGTPQR